MIYIVVPTYGRLASTRHFITSVRKYLGEPVKFVITDDHPDHPHRVGLSDLGIDVTVLVSETPLWWVGSINLAFKHLIGLSLKQSDVVVLANNDVELREESNIDIVVERVLREPNSVIVPVTKDENGEYISSGCRISCLLPYVTHHPLRPRNTTDIDFATARFLVTSGSVVSRIKEIDRRLVQYQGDYWFSKKAKSIGCKVAIEPMAICYVEECNTGLKSTNILSLKSYLLSLYDIRSANNVKFRFYLFQSFYGSSLAAYISLQGVAVSFARYVLKRVKGMLSFE